MHVLYTLDKEMDNGKQRLDMDTEKINFTLKNKQQHYKM